MAKYNFSVKLGQNTFEVTGCDSFEEAIAKVEKGIYDYTLKTEAHKEAAKKTTATPVVPSAVNPSTTGGDSSLHGTQTN